MKIRRYGRGGQGCKSYAVKRGHGGDDAHTWWFDAISDEDAQAHMKELQEQEPIKVSFFLFAADQRYHTLGNWLMMTTGSETA